MPVTTTTNRASYNCDGSTVAFAFTFPIFQTSDIKVYLRDEDGNETLLTDPGEYSVSAQNNDYSNGGTVTTVATYASTYDLVIIREVSLTQETDYVENDSFPAETLEDLVDKAIMACQQLDEKVNRAIKGMVTDDEDLDMTLPAASARAGRYLKFDDSGEPWPVLVVAPSGSMTSSTFIENVLTQDGDIVVREGGIPVRRRQRTIIRACLTGVQNITSGTYVKLNLNSAPVNVNSEFNTVTNYRWNSIRTGYYQLLARIDINALTDGNAIALRIVKNGSTILAESLMYIGAAGNPGVFTGTITLITAGDYVELRGYQNSGSGKDVATTSALCIYELI